MPQETAIIDTTIIQVKSTAKDNYGNLIVSPLDGEDVKVSSKREKLFSIFQDGAIVKLFWAEYMHKKYVARAELQTKGAEQPIQKAEVSPSPAATEPVKTFRDSKAIAEQVAVKAIVELVVGKVIEKDHPLVQKALAWCREKLGVDTLVLPEEAKPSVSDSSASVIDLGKERDLLYGVIMSKMKYNARAARNWLMDVHKFTAEDIDRHPLETKKKIIEKLGWK